MLLFSDAVLNTATLQIPHSGLTQRDFMLLPLLEIAPEVRHPVLQIPLAILTGCDLSPDYSGTYCLTPLPHSCFCVSQEE